MKTVNGAFKVTSRLTFDYERGIYKKNKYCKSNFIELHPNVVKYALVNTPQITFEITDACNLECRYCGYGSYYNDYDKRESKMLDLDKAILFLQYMLDLWGSDLNNSATQNVYISFYGGEPLMNMPFIKGIVDFLNRTNSSIRHYMFSMTTNAILLDRHIEFLAEHGFNLLISLDGDEANNSYRVDKSGNGVFKRIISNVDNVRLKYPKYFEEKVNFNAVLHNRNSVGEIYTFFKDHYKKTPSIGELNNMGIRPDMMDEFIDTYRNAYESLYQAENYEIIEQDMFLNLGLYQMLSIFLHKQTGFVFSDYLDLLFEKKQEGRTPTGTCVPFSRRVFVTVNGKILPCERIGHQFALGDISDTEVNLDFEIIAKRYNQYFEKIKKQCGTCNNVEGCIQCIFNLNDLENRPTCHGHMNDGQFSKYVAYHMEHLRANPEEYYRIMEEVVFD